jgi:hypothetical protein
MLSWNSRQSINTRVFASCAGGGDEEQEEVVGLIKHIA